MAEVNDALIIDVVSDVVCPWCYLGKERLEAALVEESRPVAVRWRPYQLDPTIPEGGLDRAEYMERKFGRDGRLKSTHDHLARLGAEVGIPFAFNTRSNARRTPSTRIGSSAGPVRPGRGARSSTACFRAYFVEGRDVGDRVVLLDVAVASGLDASPPNL